MISAGKLYLIPAPLGDNAAIEAVIPAGTLEIIRSTRYFVVEELRTARRYLSKAGIGVPIDTLHFHELNEHTSVEQDISPYLQAALEGHAIGLLSEAGVPAVADPGARLVRLAHEKNIPVVPLTGPSSLLLALMASGLNGQHFSFAGYLPVKPSERQQRLRTLEKRSATEDQTQLFIEAPYRNEALLADIINTCRPSTLLCVAANLTEPDAYIRTQNIAAWKTTKVELHKKPCIFLLLARLN